MRSGRVRFVVFRENEFWVAQCLEYDIGAQAGSLQQIQIRTSAALQCELEESLIRYGTPLSGLGGTPHQFCAIWAKRSASYVSLPFIDMPHIRVDVALCEYRPFVENHTKGSTLAEYCAWANSAGCSVKSNIFVGQTGYAERVVKMSASTLSRALEVGILDRDVLAPTTLARLNRRLGLQRLFGPSAQSSARWSRT